MARLHASLWSIVMVFCYAIVISQTVSSNANDIHGGVPMGESKATCDDAEDNIELDWNRNSSVEYTCTENTHQMSEVNLHYFHCDKYAQRPLHICYPEVIDYTEDIPTSGRHRPLWPKYGEYTYVPVQRWLHSLEHGGVVFLYHPCAQPNQIEIFKSVAENCLWKHIISPYQKIPPNMNFAVLTWKCKLVMNNVDVSRIVHFIKTKALQGPEVTFRDGQYKIGLIKPAKIVSDNEDSVLCPSMPTISAMADDFKQKSLARRIKSLTSQSNLEKTISAFMKQFTD